MNRTAIITFAKELFEKAPDEIKEKYSLDQIGLGNYRQISGLLRDQRDKINGTAEKGAYDLLLSEIEILGADSESLALKPMSDTEREATVWRVAEAALVQLWVRIKAGAIGTVVSIILIGIGLWWSAQGQVAAAVDKAIQTKAALLEDEIKEIRTSALSSLAAATVSAASSRAEVKKQEDAVLDQGKKIMARNEELRAQEKEIRKLEASLKEISNMADNLVKVLAIKDLELLKQQLASVQALVGDVGSNALMALDARISKLESARSFDEIQVRRIEKLESKNSFDELQVNRLSIGNGKVSYMELYGGAAGSTISMSNGKGQQRFYISADDDGVSARTVVNAESGIRKVKPVFKESLP